MCTVSESVRKILKRHPYGGMRAVKMGDPPSHGGPSLPPSTHPPYRSSDSEGPIEWAFKNPSRHERSREVKPYSRKKRASRETNTSTHPRRSIFFSMSSENRPATTIEAFQESTFFAMFCYNQDTMSPKQKTLNQLSRPFFLASYMYAPQRLSSTPDNVTRIAVVKILIGNAAQQQLHSSC